jgi:hypothetical protein
MARRISKNVRVGSLVMYTSLALLASKIYANALQICVPFPLPSMPSKTMNFPLAMGSRGHRGAKFLSTLKPKGGKLEEKGEEFARLPICQFHQFADQAL